MSSKDVITLTLSGLALIVSLTSAIYSARKQKTEGERQFRERITEIALALIDSGLKIGRLDGVPADYRDPAYWYERGTEIQRTAALVRQADKLITAETEELLTDVDYLTIAQAFATVGDNRHAECYYALTLKASQDPFYATTNKRAYAWYLFTIRRSGEGRRQYRSAIEDAKASWVDPEQRSIQVGWIYEEWMQTEARFHFEDRARELRENAREAYASISDIGERSGYLATLERTFELLSAPSSDIPTPGSINPASVVTGPVAETPPTNGQS